MKHSFQLFSARNFSLDETFALLEENGIKNAEGFDPLYKDAAALKAKLDAHGLSMPSGHFGIDGLEADPAGKIAIANELGMEAVFAPFLMPDQRPSDRAGWEAFGKRLAEAGKPIADAGLVFGWHNHDFEFVALEDGSYPIDAILAGGDFIKLELDLAWVFVAGLDPVSTLEKYGNRVVQIHAKDRAPEGKNADQDGWADLGHGVMDYASIGKKLGEMDVKIAVLEHDNPSDIKRLIENSAPALKSL